LKEVIVLQINNCHYRRGGADIAYLNTGKLLEDNGHKVLFFSTDNKKNNPADTSEYFVRGIDYFNRSLIAKIFSIFRFLYSFEAKKKITHLITIYKPDIAHLHLYKGSITPSILPVLKNHKIPVIITVHDYGLMCPHNLMLDGKMNICTRCVKGSAINCILHKCNRNNLMLSSISALEFIFSSTFFPSRKYFNIILAVSKFGRDLHLDSGKFGNRIRHLYNFYPDLWNISATTSHQNYFLYFGRLSKEKGISTLITAWLNDKRQSRLKVVGTGELYEQLVSENSTAENIDFMGFKSGPELTSLIKNCSFVIVPSEWYENNPLTIVEAYANGKPVIGADVGGITELIEEGKTGFLFKMKSMTELSEKIRIAENTSVQRYSELSVNARSFAESCFNPLTHFEKLMDVYTQILR